MTRRKDLPYMPLWVSKYDAKTKHLSMEEDGAYLRLLRLCWTTPGRTLPADDVWVRRQMRVDQDTYDRVVKVVLGEFFKVRAGRYVNDKLSEIFKDSLATSNSRKVSGKRGGDASAQKRQEKAASKAQPNAQQNATNPEPYPNPIIVEGGSASAREEILDPFEADCRIWANGSLVENFEGQGLATIRWLMDPSHGDDACNRDDVKAGIAEDASRLHRAGKQVASFDYFKNPILDARNRRRSKIPKVEIIDGGHDSSGQNGRRFRTAFDQRAEHEQSVLATFATAAIAASSGGSAQRKNSDSERARVLSRFADDPPTDRSAGGRAGPRGSADLGGAPGGSVRPLRSETPSRQEAAGGRSGRLDERSGELLSEGVRGSRDSLETIEGTVQADAGPTVGDSSRVRGAAA